MSSTDSTQSGKSKQSMKHAASAMSLEKAGSTRNVDSDIKSAFTKERRKTAQQPAPVKLERRSSIMKYFDRKSTAADKFRMEEQQWLSKDALGFAPVLLPASKQNGGGEDDEDNDEDDEYKTIDREESGESGSSRSSSVGRGRSGSDYDEHDELMEIDVHELEDSDIFGETFLSGDKDKEELTTTKESIGGEGDDDASSVSNGTVGGGTSEIRQKSLRSVTSRMLDSDEDEDKDEDEEDDKKRKSRSIVENKKLIQQAVDFQQKEDDDTNGTTSAKNGNTSDKLKKHVHLFAHLLTTSNALLYRKKNVVRAFQTKSPVRFEKEWGISEGKTNDWVVWNGEGDMYCIADEHFKANYIPAHRIQQNAQDDDHK